MADKKILAVRVKYPANTKQTQVNNGLIRTKTEWNLKRIATSAIVLVIIIVASVWGVFYQKSDPVSVKQALNTESDKADLSMAIYSLDSENQVTKATDTAVSPPLQMSTKHEEKLADINHKPHIPVVSKTSDAGLVLPNDHVKKAFLTQRIEQQKPMSVVLRTVNVGKNKSVALYYYTEVLGLAGRSIFHQWFYQDRLIKQYKKRITNSPWRTSSSMLLNDRRSGVWRVELLNEKHQILNQLIFTVESD